MQLFTFVALTSLFVFMAETKNIYITM